MKEVFVEAPHRDWNPLVNLLALSVQCLRASEEGGRSSSGVLKCNNVRKRAKQSAVGELPPWID